MKKHISILLALVMLISSINIVLANSDDMIFDGINYLNTEATPISFKGNLWHTGIQETDIMLPLREKWSVNVGKTYSQPVVSGDYLYILSDNKIKQVNIKNNSVTGEVVIQSKSEPSKSHITLIKNSEGWFNADKWDRLLFGSREGILYCFVIKSGSLNDSWIEWTYTATPGKAINSNPVFVFDSVTKDPYVIFGCEDNNFYILDTNGSLVQKVSENAGVSTSPLVFHTNNSSTHSVFLYGVNGSNGYLSSGIMIDGQYQENALLNKNTTTGYQMSGITGITSETVEIEGIRENIVAAIDRKGNIYCISLRTGILLWKITKYSSTTDVVTNSIPAIDEDYIYVTLNKSGKAKFIAIDYRKGIILGSQDPYTSAINSAVAYESDDNEFNGPTNISASIIRVSMKGDDGTAGIRGRIALVGDSGDKDNIRVFYTNQTINGNAKRIDDAFQIYDSTKKQYLSSPTLSLPGGAASEFIYSGGYVFITDGQGKLHAFEGKMENNLVLLNMQNSETPVQKGKTYEVTANIANYMGKDTVPLDIQFALVTDSGEKFYIDKKDIIIPAAGLTTHLSYTVPSDYTGQYFSIRCEINAQDNKGKRKATESSYTDNIQELRIKVADDVNLLVSKVTKGQYFEKTFVTTTISFKNDSNFDLQNVPVEIFIGGTKLAPPQVPDKISIGKNATINVPVLWYAEELKNGNKIIDIEACINSNKVITEPDHRYTDNVMITQVLVKKDIPDFEVVSISPTKYQANTRVITQVKIRNNSRADFVQDDKVSLEFSINSSSSTKSVELRANAETIVTFNWNAPNKGTKVTIKAEINPSHNPEETNYANNIKSINATIVDTIPEPEGISDGDPVPIISPPAGCYTSRRDWTEDRFDHWRTVWLGTRTEVDPVTGKIKSIPIYGQEAVYRTYSFYAELHISASLSKSQMKSGYGFEATVTTNLVSNYDKTNQLTGAQIVYAYFPENQYVAPLQLQATKSTSNLSNTWHFYVNEESVLKKREHFTPVWFPDKTNYVVQFLARYANSPGGQMCNTATDSIYIDGNMFEDDTTSGTR